MSEKTFPILTALLLRQHVVGQETASSNSLPFYIVFYYPALLVSVFIGFSFKYLHKSAISKPC